MMLFQSKLFGHCLHKCFPHSSLSVVLSLLVSSIKLERFRSHTHLPTSQHSFQLLVPKMSTSKSATETEERGRGGRTKTQTQKALANTKTGSRKAKVQGLPQNQHQVTNQGGVQFQASQPQKAAQTVGGRVTRSQTANQGASRGTQAQSTNTGKGNKSTAGALPPVAPRRSPRRPAPRTNTRGVSKTQISGPMIKIYEEIHQAATVKQVQNLHYDAYELLSTARLFRFFDRIPASDRDSLQQRLLAYSPTEFRAGAVVNDVKGWLDFPQPKRLMEFYRDPKLLVLTICAHSKSFRDVIARSDADSAEQGEPAWSDIYPMIRSCASSLELFGRSYHFNWLESLHKWEDHFSRVLTELFDQETAEHGILEGVSGDNLGIGPGDLVEIHEIPVTGEGKVHHHWALPIKDKQPAIRPTIEWAVNTDLARAPFVNDFNAVIDRPKKKGLRYDQPKSPIALPVESRQTLFQMDITKAAILRNHPWPAEARKNILALPTFCGARHHPCLACGMAAPAGADTIAVDGEGKAMPFDYPCSCTIKELVARRNPAGTPFISPADLLLELYTTADRGRGVRSLQRIPKNTYVGEYIGEVYPECDPATDEKVNRYGPPQGCIYHFTMKVGPPPANNPDNRKNYTIDSAHLGNWTRYMNHSCNPKVDFQVVNVGQQWTTLCTTVKEIQFGEEITTDYGGDYFRQ